MKRDLVTACGAVFLLVASPPRPARAQEALTSSSPHGHLDEPCAGCHAAGVWKPASISRTFTHAPTRFPLDGAHARTKCMACHRMLTFKGTSTKCNACHKDVHHGELGRDCARCHTVNTFVDHVQMLRFHATTLFPLTGAHLTVNCVACHPPVGAGHTPFVKRPTDCAACHLPASTAATRPPHEAPLFPTTCTSCHSTVSWATTTFDHSKTAFPLSGAHAGATCDGCHADGAYRGRGTLCVTCHLSDYNTTEDKTGVPAHVAAGFATGCEACHTMQTWQNAFFNHNMAPVVFPLTGAHTPLACTACHGDNVYKAKSTKCYSCHQPNWAAAADPPHVLAGFATTCEKCHSTISWSPTTFDHTGATSFTLSGAHARLASCNACHGDRVYKGKSALCYGCHEKEYGATATMGGAVPPHARSKYSTACETCHTTATWRGATTSRKP